jgi:DNA processing protein
MLIKRLGSPDEVFAASRSTVAALPGMGSGRVDALLHPDLLDQVRREAERGADLGVRFICLGDADYPPAVRDLASPPPVLCVRGAIVPSDRLALAVVGPRMPSEYARRMTRRLVPPLSARSITVVSGLAQGVDAEAHAAALRSDGRTLAVLGQGLDTPLYPASNRGLADRILEEDKGALISAFSLSTRPHASLYPQRNELLAALALGVLVVEAGERSGALITARHALDFGRTVLACPADADRATARGSNRLLAEGAALVQNSDDVLDTLRAELRRELLALGVDANNETDDARVAPQAGPPPASQRNAANAPAAPRPRASAPGGAPSGSDPPADALTRMIDTMVREEHRALDFILEGCAEAGFGHGAVVQRLLELEMKGWLRQLPGRIYGRPE